VVECEEGGNRKGCHLESLLSVGELCGIQRSFVEIVI
jgi:hypothetical protein